MLQAIERSNRCFTLPNSSSGRTRRKRRTQNAAARATATHELLLLEMFLHLVHLPLFLEQPRGWCEHGGVIFLLFALPATPPIQEPIARRLSATHPPHICTSPAYARERSKEANSTRPNANRPTHSEPGKAAGRHLLCQSHMGNTLHRYGLCLRRRWWYAKHAVAYLHTGWLAERVVHLACEVGLLYELVLESALEISV